MGDIINLLPERAPATVLAMAVKENLKSVLIIGETQDGAVHISFSEPDIPTLNFLVDVAKRSILESASSLGED